MLTPIPERVNDPKDAVLWAVYDCLQRIDENTSSRTAFASGIAINQHFATDHAVFEHELGLLREILKIPVPKEEQRPEPETKREELSTAETDDRLFRDL